MSVKRKINFTIVPNELIDTDRISTHAKLTYIVLCRFANKELTAFPSQKKIAERAGMSRMTVSRVMKELEDVGLIVRQERRRNDGGKASNLYILTDEITVEN